MRNISWEFDTHKFQILIYDTYYFLQIRVKTNFLLNKLKKKKNGSISIYKSLRLMKLMLKSNKHSYTYREINKGSHQVWTLQ